MEDFADKIVYIIIGLIVLVVNFATKAKKQAEKQTGKPIFQPYNDGSFENYEQAQSQEIMVDESKNSQEIIYTDETQYYKEIKKETPKENLSKNTQKIHCEIDDFDLRKAVIFSEILNRKY